MLAPEIIIAVGVVGRLSYMEHVYAGHDDSTTMACTNNALKESEETRKIMLLHTHAYAQVPAAAAGTVVGKKATQIKRFRVVRPHALEPLLHGQAMPKCVT
jgi:hypothetical protein